MKSKFILTVLAFSLLTFTSCRKNYDCYCSSPSGFSSVSESYTFVTKNDAQNKCDKYQSDFNSIAGSNDVTCTINESN